MDPNVHWITRHDELTVAISRAGSGPVSVDTEADSMHHYPEKVCLIQLTIGGEDFLLDPLAGLDVSPLSTLLADAAVRKYLHGADYDLRVLHRDFAIEVRGLFDTMIAARLVGERQFGLASLLRRRLDVQLDKKYQRADWSRRPLPDPMVNYAAMDTRYLEPLAEELKDDLQRLGRLDWADEEFQRLERVRWTDSADDETFRKVRGASKLDRRGLAVLRELVAVRESMARERDRPPFRILSADALLAIAQTRPARRAALREIRDLPERWAGGEASHRLLEAVGRAMALDETALPQKKDHRRPPRDPRFEAAVKRLCRERETLATELGLEPSVLASRAVLEEALRRLERGDDPEGQEDLRKWQAGLLRPIFARVSC